MTYGNGTIVCSVASYNTIVRVPYSAKTTECVVWSFLGNTVVVVVAFICIHVIDNKWFQTAYIRFGRWVVSSKHQVLKTPLALICHVAIDLHGKFGRGRRESISQDRSPRMRRAS